jgi:hypothetical protein
VSDASDATTEELEMTFNICGIEFARTGEDGDALMTPAAAMAAGSCSSSCSCCA